MYSIYKVPFLISSPEFFRFNLLKKNSSLNYYDSENSKTVVFKFFKKNLVCHFNSNFFVFIKDSIFILGSSSLFLSIFLYNFNLLLGLLKSYQSKLYLVGLRYKVEKIFKKSLILKLNFCNKVKWNCSSIRFTKFKKIKNAFLFKTFNYQVFILFLSLIRKFRLPDPYKGNGIRFYKEKIKFKKRKQFGSF